MTCIVGLVADGKVWMGADSCGTNYNIRRNVVRPKLFTNGIALIGYTGSFRAGQLLETKLVTPDIPEGIDTFAYMTTLFVDAVRKVFAENGFAHIENNEEEGELFLVGLNGRLFEVQEDYSVLEFEDGLAAVGAGAEYALGALKAQGGGVLPGAAAATERIETALEASAYFCPSVSAPFTIIKGEW
ncbi:MAG: hypothetical protein KIT08_01355 [Anaerolineales bacterium]|nr:MAG: hypothetical protein KIT08_01355 [Anaerolineales bacterium]